MHYRTRQRLTGPMRIIRSDSSDETSAGQYGLMSIDSTAASKHSKRFPDDDGIRALYQSIIAPVLAAVIGFDYGESREEQSSCDRR
jgi:hypothetical protein